MLPPARLTEFQWDRGNLDKSYQKHGVSPQEAEEVFLDERLLVLQDIKHSKAEARSIALGKTISKQLLFVVFTVRTHQLRIISARRANPKEKQQYEKEA